VGCHEGQAGRQQQSHDETDQACRHQHVFVSGWSARGREEPGGRRKHGEIGLVRGERVSKVRLKGDRTFLQAEGVKGNWLAPSFAKKITLPFLFVSHMMRIGTWATKLQKEWVGISYKWERNVDVTARRSSPDLIISPGDLSTLHRLLF